MEILTAEFLSALLAIIMIDLVLAGDNAIVIALAARNLPASLRSKAVVWGTVGAIAVRTVMTLLVVWLLKIPGLLLLGGAMLVWIAYKLLADHNEGEKEVTAASSFWGAMKTIIVADAVMGLDNVLAVAGAAHGSFLLVVIGLLISVPIVIGGSQIILKFVERYPGIIYLGGGVLAWTAAKMITHEPLIADYLSANPWISPLLHGAILFGVLGAGYWANATQARESVLRHIAAQGATRVNAARKGGAEMHRVLIPIDGTGNSLQAVRHLVNRFLSDASMEVHLLHVATPLSQYVARFVARADREKYHREQAELALRPAKDILDRHGIPHADHAELGEAAETIHRVAQRLHVHEIIMATARKNSLTRMLQDSVTHKVLQSSQVPVEVVVGSEVSKLEKFGVPAGIGAIVAFLMMAG